MKPPKYPIIVTAPIRFVAYGPALVQTWMFVQVDWEYAIPFSLS